MELSRSHRKGVIRYQVGDQTFVSTGVRWNDEAGQNLSMLSYLKNGSCTEHRFGSAADLSLTCVNEWSSQHLNVYCRNSIPTAIVQGTIH